MPHTHPTSREGSTYCNILKTSSKISQNTFAKAAQLAPGSKAIMMILWSDAISYCTTSSRAGQWKLNKEQGALLDTGSLLLGNFGGRKSVVGLAAHLFCQSFSTAQPCYSSCCNWNITGYNVRCDRCEARQSKRPIGLRTFSLRNAYKQCESTYRLTSLSYLPFVCLIFVQVASGRTDKPVI